VVLGLPNRPVPVDIRRAVVNEIDVVTSSAHVCRLDVPAAIELLARREIDATIVAAVIALDDLVEQGLEPLTAGSAGGKILVAIGPEAAADSSRAHDEARSKK
jgi:(R,R)-butanediol dehydrogenase/meso-butanediol dehydrogenase/diacetyl reductase